MFADGMKIATILTIVGFGLIAIAGKKKMLRILGGTILALAVVVILLTGFGVIP